MNICSPGNCICDAAEWDGDTNCMGEVEGSSPLVAAILDSTWAGPVPALNRKKEKAQTMEPEIVTVEACNRFFIVEQRWLRDEPTGWSVTTHQAQRHAEPFAYIFNVMNGPYARVYREWERADNQRASTGRAPGQFAYIVEARNKRQVVNWLLDRGHVTDFNSKVLRPADGIRVGQGGVYTRSAKNASAALYGEVIAGPALRIRNPGTTITLNAIYSDRIEGNNDMDNRTSRLAQLTRIAENAQREMETILSRPVEPEQDMIRFERTFNGGERVYTYGAIRTDQGLWYTTGPRTPKGYTWDDLIDWMMEDGEVKIEVVTKRKVL